MRQRGTLLLSLALLGGLAAGSYWLAERARMGDPLAHKLTHDPDYFAEDFTLTRMDEKGDALYTMSSKKMMHYPDDDSTSLEKPEVDSAKPDQPAVHIQANTGQVTSDAVEVRMHGDVLLTRAPTATGPALRAEGQYLLVLPEQDIAKTNQPIEVTQGGSKIWANSMEFNNTTRVVKMNEDVVARGRAILEPRKKPDATPTTTPKR